MAEIAKIEIRCDRCGKANVCDPNPETGKVIRPFGVARVVMHVRTPQMTRDIGRDLCVECTSEFERFMKGERLESGWIDPESLKPR